MEIAVIVKAFSSYHPTFQPPPLMPHFWPNHRDTVFLLLCFYSNSMAVLNCFLFSWKFLPNILCSWSKKGRKRTFVKYWNLSETFTSFQDIFTQIFHCPLTCKVRTLISLFPAKQNHLIIYCGQRKYHNF